MLKDYKLFERVGGGGYAEVFRACDTRTNMIVAIKILRDCCPGNVRRFERERAMLEAYKTNPYVINLLDADLNGETKFLVLEFSELGSLEQYITKQGHSKYVMRWMRHIIRALRPIHARGDWHRDIKPANLLLFKNSNGALFVKISDFGLGQRIDNPSGPMTHSPFGTKGYIDPVAQTTGIYNAASDMFSLGRTIRQLLTGELEGGVYPSDVPIEMQLLLNEMTRMTRDRRPTAENAYHRLNEILEPKPAPLPQPIMQSIPKIPWGWILGGAALVLGSVISNANSWDERAGRYRNSKGQYASGWLA
ncbi:MAG: eukaryotic-like serine/threonine-protein kinase [Pyrinomonadaceae bacterium]|jgi:serine/threonine-protein kinase|nr:eukaryotic-like serine/threonine-protein kinase [Pyrinomonadaceae bacterium]